MVGKNTKLSKKRTSLARKRTKLAHERTIASYIRTATTVILFGVTFFGLSETYTFFRYASAIAILIGIVFVVVAIKRGIKHSKEIRAAAEVIEKEIDKK